MTTENDMQANLEKAEEHANEAQEDAPKSSTSRVIEKKSDKKLDFSVDYSIPTLDEIALPGEGETAPDKNTSQIPIPKHILDAEEKDTPANNSIELTPELIDQLSQNLQVALTPEIEKAITHALNIAFATTMDKTSKLTKTTIRKRIEELLPKLLKEHLEKMTTPD